MRVVEIRGSFGLDSLTVTDRPRPEAGPGQVLVKVNAVSLNYRDLLVAKGQYNPKIPLPLIPGSDGVGEIVAVGPGVDDWKVGDRVAGTFFQAWAEGELTDDRARSTLGGDRDGVFAEYVALERGGVVKVPAHLTDEQAATLPCAALTAWNALVTRGKIKAGDSVLVQGTGGVSIFALQFARMMGARVIATSKSDAKLRRVRELGASDGINYQETPKWDEAVRQLTEGRGVDHIVEVGGAGTLERSFKAVRRGGRVSLIGVLAGNAAGVNPTPVLMKGITLQGIFVGSRQMFSEMNRAVAQSGLVPVVDRVFPLEEARQAFAHMESGAHFGKIVLRL
ncbi:MAG: NAD(P)-dependent alcohol dehydrogenase [Candidatus Riflebacteria bacterium]|nr:NAD(P)-dependent alcohol dehydrogenase [Candidatus Riflebacteria bacterium]